MATPYTTKEAVRELLARDSVSAGTAASLTDSTLLDVIASASALIDSKLGSVYTVPFIQVPPPAMVVRIANAVAAYEADLIFREVRDYSSDLNPVYLRYRDALALLDQLQKGLATLPDYIPPVPDPGSPDPVGGSVVGVFNPCPSPLPAPQSGPSWSNSYYYGTW
jgi:phage gp36-like protein